MRYPSDHKGDWDGLGHEEKVLVWCHTSSGATSRRQARHIDPYLPSEFQKAKYSWRTSKQEETLRPWQNLDFQTCTTCTHILIKPCGPLDHAPVRQESPESWYLHRSEFRRTDQNCMFQLRVCCRRKFIKSILTKPRWAGVLAMPHLCPVQLKLSCLQVSEWHFCVLPSHSSAPPPI